MNGNNAAETVANLRRIAHGDENGHPPTLPYPNGTFITCWNGGHCQGLLLWGGKFHYINPWSNGFSANAYDTTSSELVGNLIRTISPTEQHTSIASAIVYAQNHREEMRRWGQTARTNPDAVPETIRQHRSNYLLFLSTQRKMRQTNPNVTNEEVIREASKNSYYTTCNSSFVIKPTDPLIKEVFDMTKAVR